MKATGQSFTGASLSFPNSIDKDGQCWAVLLREKYGLPEKVPLIDMSGSEQEGKGEAKMVSIPLSSDEETPVGKYAIEN